VSASAPRSGRQDAAGRAGPAPRRLRRIELSGAAGRRGASHGAALADAIRRYTEERVGLAAGGKWSGRPATRDDVLRLAEAMLPAHRAYSPELCDEMEAMAAASGIRAAEAVIVGGFTDFVDAVRARAGEAPEEDDCTAVLVPTARGRGEAWLAQTWDMHDTATEHVVMLDVRPERGPRALVFSTAGCVGQIGMNEAGICVGINNLAAAEGRVGVTWPFVVREVLRQERIEDALAKVLDADLAGAHHYLLLDREGRGFDVEAMPARKQVRELRSEPLFHTNHCLADETRALEAKRAPELVASSHARLRRAEELLAEGPIDVPRLMEMTRDPEAICQRARPPFHIESSGAMIMRPASGELWAVWGLPSENEYEQLAFGAS
jgi:isopenicillin-N N-acyltransferase-like protein